MLKANLYATFRSIVGGKTLELDITKPTSVKDVLAKLFDMHPRLHSEILNEAGELQHHVSLFIAGRDIRHLNGLETLIEPGQVFDLFPPVAGGES